MAKKKTTDRKQVAMKLPTYELLKESRRLAAVDKGKDYTFTDWIDKVVAAGIEHLGFGKPKS